MKLFFANESTVKHILDEKRSNENVRISVCNKEFFVENSTLAEFSIVEWLFLCAFCTKEVGMPWLI